MPGPSAGSREGREEKEGIRKVRKGGYGKEK